MAPGDVEREADAGVAEQNDPRPMDEVAEDAERAIEASEQCESAHDADEEKVVTIASGEGEAAGEEEGGATDEKAEVSQEGSEKGSPETSSFARLVKGWEALAEVGARNVQRARENESFQPLQMLKELSLCGAGEGLARIKGAPTTDASGDPFEPIILRHTRSTPQQYQPMFPEEDGGQAPPAPILLDHMRRSSSTPSSSAFRQYSAGSAFGTHLRSMPHLGGPDDRSAFTMPFQRNSFTSRSDSGVRYSAFDPVWLPQNATETSENTAIEVTSMDTKPAASEEEEKPSKTAASRAARFLRMSEGRYKRRRKRKDEKESPTRPTTISVSTQEPEKTESVADAVNEASRPTGSTDPSSTSLKSTIDIDIRTTRRTPTPTPQFPIVQGGEESGNADGGKGESGEQYQQLDSDVDEEYEHFQRIETSLQQTESPTPIPSPAYQKFEDEQAVQPESSATDGEAEGGNRTPTVRIQVSTDVGNQGRSNLTPYSPDSGNQSPGTIRSSMTGNTSGHTTIATSTSATVSSGHVSVLSSVSETDMEVMETNKAGKRRVRQRRKLDSVVKIGRRSGDTDASVSVHSSSTGSTNTNGYVALGGSPAPLREGASMPVDRFFDQSHIPVGHSVSNISGSTGSSGSAGGRTSRTSKTSSDSSPSKKAVTGQGSPASMTSEMNTTNSSGSAGEEPPQFVSYLDQARKKTLPPVGDDEERESPAEIVGYSSMVFEAATAPGRGSEKPAPIRPKQKRETGRDRSGRFGSRPPLSPIKGLRTPTTPPPAALGGPDSTSPAYQQLSPPRNIIDHRMSAGLSKPYVLRSSARAGDGRTQMFVSVESETVETSPKSQGPVTSSAGGVISPEAPQSGPVYTYTLHDDSQNVYGPDPSEDRICDELGVEVKEQEAPPVNVVSPEKPE